MTRIVMVATLFLPLVCTSMGQDLRSVQHQATTAPLDARTPKGLFSGNTGSFLEIPPPHVWPYFPLLRPTIARAVWN